MTDGKSSKMAPLGGFLMALADSVPGVSGGTVAFVVGIYDSLLGSLDALISGPREQRKAGAVFLLKLMAGWVVGFAGAVLVLTSLFESHVYAVSSVFLGFVAFSIPLMAYDERACLKGRCANLAWTLLGASAVVALTLANGAAGTGPGMDLVPLDLPGGIMVFAAAAVAISAMILPGISGSTILLICGLYLPIMGAVRGLLGGDLSGLPVAVVFAAGAILGLLTVVKLVKRALGRFRSQTVYCILGLMAGSLFAIAMGPTTLDAPLAPLSPETFSLLGFVGGGALIALLEAAKRLLSRPTE